jgi:ferredoxin-fold anticodon binding domain-containing protein
VKCNYDSRYYKSEFEKLPKVERDNISKYVFVSALKTMLAIVLFRCEKLKHWKKDNLRGLYYDIVSLFQMNVFNRSISDIDLIKRYENMLGVDFSKLDEIVEVKL